MREALVLGIGNVLWADEGFGVRCVEALAADWSLPDSVGLLDGGTQGLYLLPQVQEARRLLVFDAIDFGLVPGTLQVLEGDRVPSFMGAKKMSLHQTGFQEVLAAAQLSGRAPSELVLIGVQPVELEDFGGSLRPAVRAQIPHAIGIALARLAGWGFATRRRDRRSITADPLGLVRYEAERPTEAEAFRHGDARFFARRG
ncbi:MAG: HyaD/HybD family hydrogenase maturation endopeptidase [Steroidobacteraceae bacterium]|jgi:hydrogenase maturation protease|nr:HyaD/HybD family hydrogenase maturation endopeptidase [Steroidobacteraceae bacterium]